ncbi:efflux RND transporter periplasmic adaptor subunit [Belnapia sp. T6]|uniref:Efflux RND transporter periplasmic adaptor subunit n=1 Tax=Belnapia mucosa TaxID=2804532 RepID=A0ABS1V6A9_9PROT|nr:efflux RND transporter periplasmic adaptor subunit [Belnapia mucosa]MBL6456832.1 efflux RND transporter periplasmic adaptor subunit [Belnapia mucosa]
MRRFLVTLLALVLIGGAGAGAWYYWKSQHPAPAPQAGAEGGQRRAGPGGPGGPRAGGGRGGPVPVTVAAAQRQDVPIMLDAIGTVQAYNTITVRAQVDGQLVEIAFTEGQMVKRGDVLARIDPRSYQAALDQAVAKKAQDEALLANARLDLQRYTTLARNEGVSRQQQDTQRSTVAQYEAQVAADQAAIDSAKTQLSFTTIRSPIDGRVGLRLVDQGNLVRSGDATGIVTVSQLQPIAVTFTLPQQELGRVLEALRRGKVPVQALRPAGGEMPATQGLRPAGPQGPSVGEVQTLDSAVDAATGTIKLKAVFPNEDGRLWPGAFVTVRLRIDTVPDAVTVPLVAVQRGPDGAFAFVLKPDQTVEQRPLQLGVLTASEAVVRRGVEPGERVVTSGALRLSPGTAVTPTEDAPPGNAPAPGQRRMRPRQAADASPGG